MLAVACLSRLASAQGALDDYDRALAINPKDAEALRGRGFTHLRRNETDAAIGDHGAAIALHRNDALAYHLRAEGHQAMASKLNPKGWPASR